MADVSIRNVCKYYYSGGKLINAVKNFNLDVADGEIVAILGPSGCGKSSLMRMITGLEQITRGDILIGGKKINDLDSSERNVSLAFESYALYQHYTVRENISFCLKLKKLPKNIINDKINWVSNLLNINDILDKKPGGLSGGQQQLTSLARVLVRNPSVTLLDEPISHLDSRTRFDLTMKLKEIHEKTNLTMIYVTHNQEEAMALSEKIVVMSMGELQQIGGRVEIMENSINMFVAGFIGEPSINFISCKLEESEKNGTLQAISKDSSFRIDVPVSFIDKIKKNNLREIIVGIRPIDLHYKKIKDDIEKINGEVLYHEFLGEIGNIKIQLGENTNLVAIIEPSYKIKKGQKIEMYYNPHSINFFNPKTEYNLKKD